MRRRLIHSPSVHRVHIRVVLQAPFRWVLSDVLKLIPIICRVRNSVRMITGLPDLAGALLSYSERVTALDELSGSLDRFSRSQQNVYVFGHYSKAVEQKSSLLAVSKQRGEEEFGVRSRLERASPLVGQLL
ncbi:MAG TPA: hypothetical protein VHU44_12330 [Acidobacteriaceae bacterium]|jgi:hypothetical protein|nr:hypothetical protein [Acidobacteriaceae bacterium]